MSLARILAVRDRQRAITILERIRWQDGISCPYCNSPQASRHTYEEKRPERWICNKCSCTYSVTVNTFFHRTHIPLDVWFTVIHEVIKNKNLCISQLARDLGDIRRPTVSSMVSRVRCALDDKLQRNLFLKIVRYIEEGQAPALPSGGTI
jgi:transposase-like protein